MESKLLNLLERRTYFFDKGLRFECRQCGDCCVGDSGTIYVSRPEMDRIAAHLNISLDRFVTDYLYPYKDSFSIREDDIGHCLFFDQGCRVYDVRPHQCRTFPFWFSNLRSHRRWRQIRRQCPGIGIGRRYSRREILEIVHTTPHL